MLCRISQVHAEVAEAVVVSCSRSVKLRMCLICWTGLCSYISLFLNHERESCCCILPEEENAFLRPLCCVLNCCHQGSVCGAWWWLFVWFFCVVGFFKIIQTVSACERGYLPHWDRLGNNWKLLECGNERKATGFPRVIQNLSEKQKRKHWRQRALERPGMWKAG